jgi:hypothetical protein
LASTCCRATSWPRRSCILRKAVALVPNSPTRTATLGARARNAGKLDEGMQHIRKALETAARTRAGAPEPRASSSGAANGRGSGIGDRDRDRGIGDRGSGSGIGHGLVAASSFSRAMSHPKSASAHPANNRRLEATDHRAATVAANLRRLGRARVRSRGASIERISSCKVRRSNLMRRRLSRRRTSSGVSSFRDRIRRKCPSGWISARTTLARNPSRGRSTAPTQRSPPHLTDQLELSVLGKSVRTAHRSPSTASIAPWAMRPRPLGSLISSLIQTCLPSAPRDSARYARTCEPSRVNY